MTAAEQAEQLGPVDPLVVARNWAKRVGDIADYWGERARTAPERGESPGMARIEADIAGAGRQQYEAAQMAYFMAQVSLAGDVRRIADTLTVVPAPGSIVDAEIIDDDDPEYLGPRDERDWGPE